MKLIETALLLIAYSTILITIFVSLICYKRNIEKLETVAFSISLLLLIISMTGAYLFGENSSVEQTNIFILLSMILLGLTTPLSIMTERQHNILPIWKKILFIFSVLLFSLTIVAYFINQLGYLEYIIAFFLGGTVIFSMLLVRVTKPQENVAHLEQTNRIFSIIFLILVPIALLANYVSLNVGYHLKIGFTLPLVFTLLAVNKLLDDLHRLSLINPKNEPNEQHFKNYALSKREKEVARLLAKGKTYKEISAALFISMPTVKTHASNIYKKCKVNNRHELTVLITN